MELERYRFFLDGTQLAQNPMGWADGEIDFVRDKTIDGLLVAYSSKLTFFGDGYDYIKGQFDANGFCELIKCDIVYRISDTESFDVLFKGVIFVSDCVFDLQKCFVECVITDDSFSARIQNNKQMKAIINVGTSKNGLVISPATSQRPQFGTPPDGSFVGNRTVFRAYDCFKFLIDFMTDGTVGFASHYFSEGGEGESLAVTTGQLLRNNGGSDVIFPDISFNDLFTEVNKKFNISFGVETVNGKRIIRIENKEYFYQNASALTLNNVPNIKEQIDTSTLYSVVKIGSGSPTDFNDGDLSMPPIRFLGWLEESYNTVGTCNVDNTLDLVSQWIIDSNTFQDIFKNANTGYDNDTFLVMIDWQYFLGVIIGGSVNMQQLLGPIPPSLFINGALSNKQVMQRWLGSIPNSVAKYLGNGDDTFSANGFPFNYGGPFVTAITINTLQFPNIISNPGGNYSAVTNRYTAAASGLYSFIITGDIHATSTPDGGNKFNNLNTILSLVVNNSDNTLLQQYDVRLTSGTNVDIFLIFKLDHLFENIFIPTGAYCFLSLSTSIDTSQGYGGDNLTLVSVNGTPLFTCVTSVDGGGIYQTYEPSDFKAINLNFTFPLKYPDFKTLVLAPEKIIRLTGRPDTLYSGWIDSFKYKVRSGLGTWKLINDQNHLI